MTHDPDALADALERRIGGVKVVSGDLTQPGRARFILRATPYNYWDAIHRAYDLAVSPGRVVWTVEPFALDVGGDEDTFALSVQPRTWIGAPATGAFIAHLAGRMLAAPPEVDHG